MYTWHNTCVTLSKVKSERICDSRRLGSQIKSHSQILLQYTHIAVTSSVTLLNTCKQTLPPVFCMYTQCQPTWSRIHVDSSTVIVTWIFISNLWSSYMIGQNGLFITICVDRSSMSHSWLVKYSIGFLHYTTRGWDNEKSIFGRDGENNHGFFFSFFFCCVYMDRICLQASKINITL